MSPRSVTDALLRESPVLREEDPVGEAVRALLDTDLPALPVQDARGRLAGLFGEREFFTALFPGYLGQLSYAGFVTKGLEATLEKRSSCRVEPVGRYLNREHVDVQADFSDAQVAEIFLHHRVLLVPVTDRGAVVGVILREDFFRTLAQRFLGA